MAVSLRHATQATGTDAGNGEIGKTQWNEEHALVLATGKLIGRSTAGDGAAEEISVGTGLSLAAGSLGVTAGTYAPAASAVTAIGYTISGGGAVIATGVAGNGLYIPYACTIESVTMLADVSGSIVVDIWKDSYANYPPTVADSICAAAKPTISSAIKSQDTTLTGWAKTVNAGDILRFNVDSVSTIEEATIILKVTKT